MSRHPELPERDRRILGVVVQAYIDQGEPVSSLWLANRGFGVSSATLRNVMARLEEQGYVRQPHTSAGRVPTDQGYRIYVDQLLAERKSSRPAPQIEARLRRAGTVGDMLSHVSQEVSRASHQVGFAIAPPADMTILERLDFVPLDGGKLLVVVVAAGGHVSHKVIDPSEEYGPGELQQASNYLNQRVQGTHAARRPAGRARAAAARSARSTTSCWGARCAWRARRSRTSTPSRRSSSRARRSCSRTSAARIRS